MMKKLMTLLLFVVVQVGCAQAQTNEETITKTGSFRNLANAVLSVENIHGDVKIEAYNGDKVQLTVKKIISAKNKADVEKGMREVQLKFIESGDSVYVYLDAPFIFRKGNRTRYFSVHHDDDINYHYKFDMTLKVPASIKVTAGTVNDGEVTIDNVTGSVKARNVNGGIKLTGVGGNASATTVNGKVDVTLTNNPTEDCQFKTINGNVNVKYAPGLNANVAFKSMNGEFFTDLGDVEMLPIKVVKNSDNSRAGTVFKIDRSQQYKVGKGGPTLSFETLNGNICLKKN